MTVVAFDSTSSPKVDITMNCIGRLLVATIFVGATSALGCGGEGPESPPTVDIVAEDYEFQAPDTVPAGWVTLRLHNQGSEIHYMEIDRLAGDVTPSEYRAWRERASALEDSLHTRIVQGTIDTAEAVRRLRAASPDNHWGGSPDDLGRDVGGVGLLGPGESAQTTLRLKPGTYRLTCGMPTAEGKPHATLGMTAPLVVSGPSSEASPSKPDVVIRYEKGEVITEGQYEAGRQLVAFHVGKVAPTEETGKIDAHLVDLDGTSREALVRWVTEEGFRPPAPATFLGGPDEIREGDTAYVALELDAGRYGWVFTPDAGLLLRRFTVE